MKIYTSYFSNSKRLAEAGVKQIGIALYPPKWFKGVSLKCVAPTASILYGSKGQEDYTRRYQNEVLSNINPKYFLETVESYSGGRDVALCCFEKPGDFCHRHLLAEWLRQVAGISIEEFHAEVIPHKPDATTQSLF